MSKTAIHTNQDALPILVGVIGHRDLALAQVPLYEAQIRAALKAIDRAYSHTPVYVVTSLAEGADGLGAKVAVEDGYGLVSLLPMEADEYKATFTDPDYAPSFDHFLDKSLVKFVCRSYDLDQPDDLDSKFARAGAAVMQYSHIVIALWDGVWTGYDAGTSFLIRHAIEGIPKHIIRDLEEFEVSPLDPVSTATVRRIPVERVCSSEVVTNPKMPVQKQNSYSAGKFADIEFKGKKKLQANLKLSGTQAKMLRHFNRFNKDIHRYRPKQGWQQQLKEHPLVDDLDIKQIGNPGLEQIREKFAMTDYLSNHFQRNKHYISLKVFIIVGALIAFIHQLVNSKSEIHQWVKLPNFFNERLSLNGLVDYQKGWPFMIYALLVVLSWVIVEIVRRRRWYDRYLDYRTIAEATRTQFFWLLGGIRAPVVHYFLRKQHDELEWIRGVLRLWYIRAITENGFIEKPYITEAKIIEKDWIEKERNKSLAKARQSLSAKRKYDLISGLLVLILFASVVAKAFSLPTTTLFPINYQLIQIDVTWSVLLTLIGALAGALAILVSSVRYFFYIGDAYNIYTRNAILFSDAGQFFDPEDGINQEERDVLLDLGRESLAENGDWLLSNRKRKIKMRAGKS